MKAAEKLIVKVVAPIAVIQGSEGGAADACVAIENQFGAANRLCVTTTEATAEKTALPRDSWAPPTLLPVTSTGLVPAGVVPALS